ncbi:MAG TPA: ABC transporter substrate-binding protein [Candidatus Corynebacterium gallistercoris]|uniref:ABC transporter substrate-binding protein n=1 Tax=Candidatus Corynebacterium gallistercoris TaxID=2838530 RepID=A0A9D1RYC6_9CORY|nr:ABC transporter substrate-binding protein [Candidatus Corynebacterium gallistercoris]
MNRSKKATAAASVAAAALLGTTLVACGSDNGSGGGDNGAIIVTDGTEPQNPLLTTNTNETGGGRVLDQIYTGLVRYENDGSVVNAVAESIEPNDDATEFTIKLKDDWTFTNGEKVTADSFIKAWNYGAATKNGQLQADFFEPIEGYDQVSQENSTVEELSGLEKISDTEFKVKLSSPESDFPTRLGHSPYMPWPEAAWDDLEAYGENPIGNGPYKMAENGWVHNETIKLVANEDYSGENKPKNGGIEFKMYSNLDTTYADLQSGNIDIVYNTVPASAMAVYKDDFPDSNADDPYAAIQNVTIPERLEHFGDDEEGKLRRQAISMSINRELVTDKIYHGGRVPAKDFGAPTLGDGTPEIEGNEVLDHNAEKAKELWKQADEIKPWSGTFEIAYNADGGHKEWVEAVTNDISQTLGITANGKSYPTFKAMRDEITNKTITTAFRSGWVGDYPSIANFLAPNFATSGSSNDGEYSNEEFDKLLKEAAAETDKDKARELYNKAQAIIMDELPAIPMWYYAATVAWSEDLSNVEYNWKGVADFANIEKK